MSFDMFVLRYVAGEPAPLDRDVLDEVLGPYVAARDPAVDLLQLRVGERGGADVWLRETSLTLNHVAGQGALDLVCALLRRLGAVLALPGGTVVLYRDEDRERLPPELRDAAVLVVATTGAELGRAIRES
ncbi:hypothetical protein [Streptomyces tritici]|uniref:hypothetical protein n=1 Tax=Streptomyces tritici TaxID=2054410 RepID=UPI003AF041DB